MSDCPRSGNFQSYYLHISKSPYHLSLIQDPESAKQLNFNNDIEICVGKKNKLPKRLPSFKRRPKPKSQYENEKKDAKVSNQFCNSKSILCKLVISNLVAGFTEGLQTNQVSLQNVERSNQGSAGYQGDLPL